MENSPRKPIGESRVQNEVLIIPLAGSLDVSLQRAFKEELETLTGKQTDVVLDFTTVTFIDSSCLGALVSLTRAIRGREGDFRLAGLSENTRSIFQITRMERVFKIYDTVEDAIASYYR